MSEQLIFFHYHAVIFILIIITKVIIHNNQNYPKQTNKQTRQFIVEGQIIEAISSIAPAVTLLLIAIPSLPLLYLIDKVHNPVLTLEAVGHQ